MGAEDRRMIIHLSGGPLDWQRQDLYTGGYSIERNSRSGQKNYGRTEEVSEDLPVWDVSYRGGDSMEGIWEKETSLNEDLELRNIMFGDL